MSIEVVSVTKLYGKQKAVNDVSFQVRNAEIVGFLGPNGAGKSTTMKMITGYLMPDSGAIRVNGLAVGKHPLETKRNIGYLSETNPLYYDMYVKEYLRYIAEAHGLKRVGKKVEDVIDVTGLTPERTKKAGQLSKGYKQRLGLAAALIHDPKVLILDEPTTGLDPNQVLEIRQLIELLGQNKTVLFSSHILQEVEAVCKRVVIIDKGKVVADDLLNNLTAGKRANVIQLKLQEEVEQAWLLRIPFVTSVEKKQDGTWLIGSNNDEAVKKKLVQLAMEQNLNIVSLQSGAGGSLEEVFKLLTGKSAI